MDKYTFNHSGDELLELVTMAISSCGTLSDNLNARMFFDEKYALQSIDNLLLLGRIYSSRENYIDFANKVVRREPDVISDMQKIIMILRTPSDIEGNRLLFNILKGINKNKIAKDIRDFEIKRLYSHFLYKNGYAGSDFRVDDAEINKTLLLRLLEAERPEERDFEILVENAESLGVSDEDIAKIYVRMKYVYESEGTYVNGELQASGKIVEITKYFKPVKERIETKKQEQQSQQDENMPKSLEEALAEIRRLRQEVKDLRTHNNVLAGRLKIQSMQPGNANVGMMVQQERNVLHI